jgi:DNA-binding CsgD family transcriptional regulator/tetratricopeptide (TPR) repeat protein
VLHGRDAERARITALVDEAWAGRGGALVVRGQPGVGKSSLLRDAIERMEGTQVLTTRGIESESPLPFAALQRLLRPVMSHAARLPAPQSAALRAAFGETEAGEDAPGGDRFLVFLATLSLLAEAAEQAPVACVVDDAHWLDDASAAALLFTARRLGPERMAMLFAAREGDVRRFEVEDLPELRVGGLDLDAAQALLREHAGADVSGDVTARLLEQTQGNPLALVELPGALSAGQLSGSDPLPPQLPLTAEVQRVFLDRSRRLSEAGQTLMLVAAADDSVLLTVIRAALAVLGTDPGPALEEAEDSGLLRISGPNLELRHPLVRSAVYQGASSGARKRVHAALAEAMVVVDPDRRAWHLAASIDEPDEAVVAELDAAAARAQARGGYEAASAALERAAELSAESEARARRLFGAANNAWLSGQPVQARTLAEQGRQHASDPVLQADLDRLRGRMEFIAGSVQAGIRVWDQAARSVAAVDPVRACEIAMIATAGSTFIAREAQTDLTPDEVLPAHPGDSLREQCFTGLLVGFHHLLRDELEQAATSLRAGLAAGRSLTEADLLTNIGIAAFHLGDDEAFRSTFTRLLAQSRDSGAIGLVLFALPRLALADLSAGQLSTAMANATEALQLARSTGQQPLTVMPLAELALHAAIRGEDSYADLLADLDRTMSSGQTGILGELVHDTRRWAQAWHDLLTGQPASAVHQLEQMTIPSLIRLAAYERLDAAVRAGRPDLAQDWLSDLERFADAVDSPRSHAVVCYGRALLAPAAAEEHYRAALTHQEAARRPLEAARTHLGYGEFLRRARRRVDAREQLRAALTIFEDVGAAPLAERARTELRASGETARRRDDSTVTKLTAQERQVARHVAQGLSTRDVAAQLFLSPRTIDFHLRNVFAKTGISSRAELARLDLN